MTSLHWKDVQAKVSHTSSSATGDIWFAIAMVLTGVIMGYLIGILYA